MSLVRRLHDRVTTTEANAAAEHAATNPPTSAEPAGEGRATYTALFGIREFRALFTAHVVSMLGTVVAEVALTVLVFARTGSPALAALTFTVGFLPYLFGGALLGGLVERVPPRRTLVVCDLASALCFVAMAAPGLPVWALLVIDFGAGLIAPVFGGTRAALMPKTIGGGAQFVLGRASMRMVAQGSQVLGFAMGGLLLAVVGARTALIVDAGSFVASAVLLRIGLRAHQAVAPQGVSLVRDSLRGLRAVLGLRPVRRLVLLRWLIPTCAVAPEALGVPYVHAHGGSQRLIGVYLAMIPAAMVTSDLFAARLLTPQWQRRIVVPAALATAIPLLAFAFRPGIGVAMALLVVVGLGYSHGLALDSLLLATVPPQLQARALGVDQAGLMFLQGLGFGVWGGVAEVLPLQWAIALAGGCGVAVVLLLRPPRGRHAS
jgi:Transmembrane secretion effector